MIESDNGKHGERRSGRRAVGIVKAIVSVGLIALLIGKLPFAEVLRQLTRLELGPALVFLALSPLMIAVSTSRWYVLLRRFGVSQPWRRLYSHYWIALFYNNLLPSTVGGDVYRIVAAAPGQRALNTAVILLERLWGLVVLLFLGSVALCILPGFPIRLAIVMVVVSCGVCCGLLALLSSNTFFRFCEGSLRHVRPKELQQRLRSMLESLRLVAGDRKAVAAIIGLSLCFHALTLVNVSLGFKVVGSGISPVAVFASVFPVTLVSALPISLNGLGLREGAYVFFLGTAGLDPVIAASVALLLRAKGILIAIVGGIMSMLRVGREPVTRVADEPEVAGTGE